MKRSLKTKILSILIGLLFITVAFNLAYSYRLFVNDKTSYIFEAGLRQTENLNDQLNFKIREFQTFLGFQENTTFTEEDFQKIFGTNEEVIAVGQLDASGKVLKLHKNNYLIQRLKNRGPFNLDIEEDQVFLSPLKARINEIELVNLSKGISGYAYITQNDARDFNFFITTKESIESIFKNNSLFSNLYLNLKKPTAKNSDLARAIKDFPGQKGTLEFNTSPEDQLVSFVKSNDKEFASVSLISKNRAFQVTSKLINQAVLFGIFLLGILITIGVFFSASLVQPILELTELTEEFSKGNFHHKFRVTTTDEISVLGNTFNHMSTEIESLLEAKVDMINKLEEANIKLEDYSHNLEQKVEQRTIELKRANDFMGAMVNSLDQGLMVFDQDLKCHDIYTVACESLFNMSPKGKTFYEVLGKNDAVEIETLKDWSTILFSEMLPFESAVPLGPSTKVTGLNFTDADFKHIVFNYYPMRDENQKISNIVAVATDKTQEIQFLETSKEKQAYVNMVIKILSNKSQFQNFMKEVDNIIEQLGLCYDEVQDSLNLDLAMMLFHTLNGGFGLYSLFHLQKLARENESIIVKVRSGEKDIESYKVEFHAIVARFHSEYNRTIVELDQTLSTNFSDGVATKEINFAQIESFKSIIDKINNDRIKNAFYDSFINEPVRTYFQPYDDLIKTVSKGAGKNILGLTMTNGDLKINPAPFKEFFNVLVHLFRNCIDHGIESESVRLEHGKTPDGKISVDFNINTAGTTPTLNITIQDDGAGIDPAKIKKRLNSLFPDENFDSLSDHELVWKIFDPFFSTRDEVSALSGRGVGMSAIKSIVDAMNGEIQIESHVGKGSIFSFVLPMSQ